MEIVKETGNETVLKLFGCLDTSAAPEFTAALEEIDPEKTLVIDFSGLEFIASSGLRALVAAKKRTPDRRIVLSGMNEVVADVFDVTGLNGVFEIK